MHEAFHAIIAARRYQGSEVPSHPSHYTARSRLPRVSTMGDNPQRSGEGRETTISALNAAIEAVNIAKELSSITPAKAAFGTVGAILAMVRVSLLLAPCWVDWMLR